MAFCRFTIAGYAVAARELGYRTVARLVLDQSFSPARIVALFGSNASKSARRDLAFVLLAGSVARYRARPIGWSGEPDRATYSSWLGDLDSNQDWRSQSPRPFVDG